MGEQEPHHRQQLFVFRLGGGGDAQVTVAEPPYQNPAVTKQRIHPTRVLQPHIDKIGAAVVNPFDQSVLFQPPEPAKQPVRDAMRSSR